jgi:hypothetical protein
MTDNPHATESLDGVPEAPDLHALGTPQLDHLAGMVLELAAQLHAERTQVRTLEHALLRRGVLTQEDLDADASNELTGELRTELDRALSRLLSAPTERDDARTPLREESTVSQRTATTTQETQES